MKLRPADALPAGTVAELDAARNEFEPFQIAIHGGAAGRTIVGAMATSLAGPGGHAIASSQVYVHREGLLHVPSASSKEGTAGLTPDPLVPDVDPMFGEKRNAFPLTVPVGELRALWVDVLVPADAPPGTYSGALELATSDGPFALPVSLRVRDFSLPSTASLKTAFAGAYDVACVAHFGSMAACTAAFGGTEDDAVETLRIRYARAMLDHRISTENVVYKGPPTNAQDFVRFDKFYGDLLGGTANTLLAGARLTTVRLRTRDTVWVAAWRDHFAAQGWTATLFDYTCDEPPNGCSFASIPATAATVRAANVATLVTTSLESATNQGVIGSIDILVPLLNGMSRVAPGSGYANWLAGDAKREVWWYQSCESHGCGDGCGDGGSPSGYLPNYVLDALPIQARAMEWLTFNYGIGGELYYSTTHSLETAWDDQCAFDGAGDGNMFYPGTPAKIGGTTDVPIASIRLKLVREGVEDYEYLHRLVELGDANFATEQAQALFPNKYDVRVEPSVFYAARKKLADRIEELTP